MACSRCKKNRDKQKMTVKKIVHGSKGLVKSLLNIGVLPTEDVNKRRDVCRECPHSSKSNSTKYQDFKGLTTFSECDLCGCNIAAKTKLKDEQCPDGRW